MITRKDIIQGTRMDGGADGLKLAVHDQKVYLLKVIHFT
jgi:hypothetical protein